MLVVDPAPLAATDSRIEESTKMEETGGPSPGERRRAVSSRDDELWEQVNAVLERRPGWSVQESPTPGVGPYWAFMSHGKVDLSVFIDGAAVHLYEEDTDRDVRFENVDELTAWLDSMAATGAPRAKPDAPRRRLHWG